jgi:hypothetical protein
MKRLPRPALFENDTSSIINAFIDSLSMDRNFVASYDGIKIINLVDWLLS